jgi:hypothetical protein
MKLVARAGKSPEPQPLVPSRKRWDSSEAGSQSYPPLFNLFYPGAVAEAVGI